MKEYSFETEQRRVLRIKINADVLIFVSALKVVCSYFVQGLILSLDFQMSGTYKSRALSSTHYLDLF